MPTITLVNGTDKTRYPSNVELREMTVAEYKSLGDSSRNLSVWVKCLDGRGRKVRVSGKPKIRKTRPNDVKVPVKYEFYESAYIGTLPGCLTGYVLVREY